jgi:hypothetical protein
VNCLDAETLAAWFDDGLSGAALEEVRSHVAGCARCQALVGAMGRTRAAVPAPETTRSPRWWLAWAVPAAAAATAVAIWVAVPRPANVTVNPSPASTLQKEEAQAQSTPPAAAPVEAVPVAPPARAAAPTLQAGARSADASPSAAPPAANEADAKAAPAAVNELSAQSAPAAPSPAERRAEAARPAAAAAQLQDRDAFVANTRCGPMWPAPPSDVVGQITAAAAPSDAACWMVGRAGTVLRSTDRQTWQRVSFPQAVDLSRITATDAQSATVFTADGRTFSTTDGGVSWTQR